MAVSKIFSGIFIALKIPYPLINARIGSPKAWTYRGYETLDDLKYAVVTTNQEVYNCENNVEAAEHASTPDPGKSVEASECTTEETSKTSADTETATEEN